MTIRLGINGFGRIGRCVQRAILQSGRTDVEVVAINDLTDRDNLSYLFRYDSVHGRYDGPFENTPEGFDFGKGPVRVSAERDPGKLDWSDVDIALECTGFFKSKEAASAYLDAGADRVLISAPGKGADRTVVFGVNHDQLTADDRIVSNGSCTTNCLSPVARVLQDRFGITQGLMTTIHAYTGSQPVLDRGAKDYARGRAAAMSMVPTTTGAAKAVGLVLPELDGRLDGVAIRVPTPNVSAVDFKFNTERELRVEAINDALKEAAAGPMAAVLGVVDEPLVSVDLGQDPRSSIVALPQTRAINGKMGRVLSWYDNEWGFSNRMADVAAVMGGL